MDRTELRVLKSGPAPDDSQCRDVSHQDLRPGECDQQTQYGTPGITYCGAPKVKGFVFCRYHLFVALNSGYPVKEFRE